jgi:hypothetical protein
MTAVARANQIVKDQIMIVDFFVRRELVGGCFIASVLFKELLSNHGITSELVEGWWHFDKFKGRHYWVEIDGKAYDTAAIILKKLAPQYPAVNISRSMPLNKQDMNDNDRSAMESAYRDYINNNVDLVFENAPLHIKSFLQLIRTR